MSLTEVLLDRLDSLWRRGIVPNLEEMLTDFNDLDGRSELCAADLEWRWRNRERDSSISLSAADYRYVLGDAWNVPAYQQRLIDSEWLARSAWGDKPHIDHYVARYQLSESQTTSLWEQLDHVVQVNLMVKHGGANVIDIKCPQDLVLGRQNPWEPPFPAWIPETRRLVVADVQQRFMSRKQLGLRRTRAREIELTNISEHGDVRINYYTLSPGGAMNALLPFVFNFNSLEISVFAASS